MKKLGYALAASLIALAAVPAVAGEGHGDGHHKHGKHGEWFKSLDTDGDGKVSQAEFDAPKAERFAKADADSDGKVTLEELTKAFEQKQAERMKKHEARLKEHFAALDKDGDGAVSAAEAQASHGEWFGKLDTDGDGFVTENEMKAHKESFKERKGDKDDKPAS